MKLSACLIVCLASLWITIPDAFAHHVHFIHQSTGDNWLRDYDEWDPDWGGGNLRADLESDGHIVTDNWHDDDNAPYCSWDPEWQGLCALFINDGARLPDDARNADIIIIKSCFYPTEYLIDDEVLNGWISHSISDIVQGYFNNHPDQNLIYCSSVPHHRQGENCPPAPVRARGRSWGEWLEDTGSGLARFAVHGNVVGFSAFAHTARGPGESPENTLRSEYEISYPDNHMNRTANLACAAVIRDLVNEFYPSSCICPSFASEYLVSVIPTPSRSEARISYSKMNKGDTIFIHDLLGRIMAKVAVTDGDMPPVWNLETMDGGRVSSGTYVVSINGNEGSMGRIIVRE